MVCGATTPLGVYSSGRSRRHAVPPDEGRGDIDLSQMGAWDTVKKKAGSSKARTYYVVRCRSCGRLGSYEPLDQAQARVDQHRSHSSQADHEVVITKHPKLKRKLVVAYQSSTGFHGSGQGSV